MNHQCYKNFRLAISRYARIQKHTLAPPRNLGTPTDDSPATSTSDDSTPTDDTSATSTSDASTPTDELPATSTSEDSPIRDKKASEVDQMSVRILN